MRADHQREGGVFALLSLILFGSDGGKHNVLLDAVPLKRVESRANSPSSSMVEFSHINVEEKKFPHPWVVKRNLRRFFIILSMVGSGLLLGDGVITPAISVLSAVEGLEIASESLKPAVIPVTIVILLLLFLVQQFGTGKVGIFFGPIMVLWFITLAGIGIYQISYNPSIFKVISPYYAYKFFANNGLDGWESLGAVVLCITGCEAMYADMGHFGKNAVRIAWLIAVYPALILNYLGQAAMLIRTPATISDPFYRSLPHALFWPIFVLGIMATIIASQALISGAFSLTQQAVSLASFPRLKIVHTSSTIEGQIYIPAINFLLMVCCLLLVIGFRSSDRLANAYGVAVCGDMFLTSLFFLSVAFLRWRWHPLVIAWLAIEFWVVDLAFLTSNLRKVPSGGWFPLGFAAILVVLMYVWRWGNLLLKSKIHDEQVPVETLVLQLKENQIAVCSGVGVFMSAVSDGIPHVCTQFLKHVPVMHKIAIFVTIHYKHEPFVTRTESRLIPVTEGIYRLVLESGYMETTLNVNHLSEVAQLHNMDIDFSEATYYLGNELVGPRPEKWTGHKIFVELFNILLQFSHKSTATSFNIPDRNLIYVGGNYLI
eukprot:Phypoly_transcript_03002.p1 GENE.Phypoly_transcript_03002~~Phypoly_transcript_03002.p1  ORF type:complete len:600 (+),score=40.61 Phypoly_transcript_03002:766-2565(+)